MIILKIFVPFVIIKSFQALRLINKFGVVIFSKAVFGLNEYVGILLQNIFVTVPCDQFLEVGKICGCFHRSTPNHKHSHQRYNDHKGSIFSWFVFLLKHELLSMTHTESVPIVPRGALQRCYKLQQKKWSGRKALPLADNYLNKSIAQVSSAQLYCVIYSP